MQETATPSKAETRSLRRRRTFAVLPTMFTLANLICGFFAIVVASRIERPPTAESPRSVSVITMNPIRVFRSLDPKDENHNILLSSCLIFLAMVFDALDGHIARLAHSASDFGAQLDSLSDAITFGVAPGFLLAKLCHRFTFINHLPWVIGAMFAACAALRLARFNVEVDEDDDHLHFSGLPSPAAAASVAGFGILFYVLRTEADTLLYHKEIDQTLQMVVPFYAALVALLMVSRVPYPHIVNQAFGQRSFAHIVALMFTGLVLMLVPGYAVPLVALAFVLWGPGALLYRVLVQKRAPEKPLF